MPLSQGFIHSHLSVSRCQMILNELSYRKQADLYVRLHMSHYTFNDLSNRTLTDGRVTTGEDGGKYGFLAFIW